MSTTKTKKTKKSAAGTKVRTTHYVIVMDRSGSMSSTKEQAVESYNMEVRAIKNAIKEDPNHQIFVSLVTFSGHNDIVEHLWQKPAEELVEAKYESYITGGWTAMWDAMGYAIDKIAAEVELGENDGVCFITISDGGNNDSPHVSAEVLRSKIDESEATEKWTFRFLGCTKEQIQSAQAVGLKGGNCATWDNSTPVKAYAGVANHSLKSMDYLRARSCGATKVDNLYSATNEAADFACDEAEKVVSSLDAVLTCSTTPKQDVFGQGVGANWAEYQSRNSTSTDTQKGSVSVTNSVNLANNQTNG